MARVKDSGKPYDVFLAFSPSDADKAAVVREALETSGLAVFDPSALVPGEDVEDRIREAVLEARALVLVVSRKALQAANTPFYYGVASAWAKPVYIALDGMTSADLPAYLHSRLTAPIGEVAAIVAAIQKSRAPLTEEQLNLLADVYRRQQLSADQLLLQPAPAARFTKRFNQAAGTNLSADQVLQELMRLRKQGKLAAKRQKAS